jgi:hypothetical protein
MCSRRLDILLVNTCCCKGTRQHNWQNMHIRGTAKCSVKHESNGTKGKDLSIVSHINVHEDSDIANVHILPYSHEWKMTPNARPPSLTNMA